MIAHKCSLILVFWLLSESHETTEHESNNNTFSDNELKTGECTTKKSTGFENLAEKIPKCPPGMTYYRHFLGIPFCYILTDLQTFPPMCPYTNFLEFDAIIDIYKPFRNLSLWVQAYRDTTNSSLSEFHYLDPSTRYLTEIKNYENPTGSFLTKNCLIRQNHKLIPVACTEKYPVLCVYTYWKIFMEKYCTKRNNFVKCISTSFDSNNKCYCYTNVDGIEVPRKLFCDHLAEPKERFQNHLLLYTLSSKASCWFGIQKTDDGYRWSSSNDTGPSFQFWKKNTDFSKMYGSLDYSNPKGWTLHDDYELKCAICEMEVPFQNVNIYLLHLPKSNEILITILNLFDVHMYYTNHYVLACFSDYSHDSMKVKIISQISDFLTITKQNYTLKISVRNNHPAYYWCETIQYPNLKKVVSNKLLVYNDDLQLHGREYSLILSVPLNISCDPFLKEDHIRIGIFLSQNINKTLLVYIRPLKIVKVCEQTEIMLLLYHISSLKNNLTSPYEFNLLHQIIKELPKYNNISKFSRSGICLEAVTNSSNVTLTWPETNLGATAVPKELCLTENFDPVVRKCEGDFLEGAEWGPILGECNFDVAIPKRTLALYELLNEQTENTEHICSKLIKLTTSQRDVLVIDVHYVAEIIEKLGTIVDFKSHATEVDSIIKTCSNLMEFESNVLIRSQMMLNSTDRTLDVLDRLGKTIDLSYNNKFVTLYAENLVMQVSNLRNSNITGIAIWKSKSITENFMAHVVYKDMNFEEIMQNDVDLAVALNEKNMQDFKNCQINSGDEFSTIKLIFTFFNNNTLFNSDIKNDLVEFNKSLIIGIYVSETKCVLENPISVMFKVKNSSNGSESCAFWNYGQDSTSVNTKGTWKFESHPRISKINSSTYAECQFFHMTHFALLMIDDDTTVEYYENKGRVVVLNLITAIGCGLSLLGLSGIFITAIVFKSWRRRARNIITINYSMALASQMVMLFVADKARENSVTMCYISGTLLHYTVLAEFAWMLIIAILQYRKFVLVFKNPINNLIWKCVAIGWGLPLFPVIVMSTICSESYEEISTGICYLKKNCFYYGVVMPVGAIILVNLYVFIVILHSVCNRKVEAYGAPKNDHVKLQVLLVVLLFFLLGMSWIFGLAASLFQWIFLSYLFCLTATIQGFVISIFFVVMNKNSRSLWLNIEKMCFCVREEKLN